MAAPDTTTGPARASDPLYPLHSIYLDAQRPLPVTQSLPGHMLPEPQRGLLVHHRDMTPTLERFYSDRMGLKVLQSHMDGASFWREVVLFCATSRKPVEYGAIRIFVDNFAAGPREAILACKTPLGTVLNQFAVHHRGRPKAYFSVIADFDIASALHCAMDARLYGRCNVLENEAGDPLAEIVEILP